MTKLVSAAGGDPWAVDTTLQRGRPAEISSLAQAFHDAGNGASAADIAFADARSRFERAWNRETGEHPINDAAEVEQVTRTLADQVAQLPKIAADLETVAAILAEAQRASRGQISTLEHRLEAIDRQLGEAYELLRAGHLAMAREWALDDIVDGFEHDAVNDTVAALDRVNRIRDRYSESLHRSMTALRDQDGYDATLVTGLAAVEPAGQAGAERDVHAALAGDVAAAERVNAVLDSITAEQRAGGTPLTAEQAGVLGQLQAQQHGMSIDALWSAEQRLGDQREMIGNSWQLMSNTAILFPATEPTSGASPGSELLNGGAQRLPGSVETALTTPWVLSVGGMSIIGNVVKDGNPAFQTNTELDRTMIRRASAAMATPDWRRDPASNGRSSLRDNPFDPVVAGVLAAASPDHRAVHDMLTGPDGAAFLDSLTRHHWSDGGKAVGSLFDWTQSGARGPDSAIAGGTARAYASYLGANEPQLLHLPGNHTLGQVNPDLVRSIARGLTPYVGNIAGTSGAVAEFGGSLENGEGSAASGTMAVAKAVFSVLSTDHDASDQFNGAADRQALLAESGYGREFVDHPSALNSYNENLHDAATLRGLVAAGVRNAAIADVENHQLSEDTALHTEYDHRKSAYELAAKGLSGAAGLIPGVGPSAGLGVGMLTTALENDVVGPAPTGSAAIGHPLPEMSVGQADREILNALIASGQHVPVPGEYLVDGRIATLDELAGRVRNLTSGRYDHVLNRALTELFAQNSGDTSGGPLIADRDMILRYNAVIADPDPLHR
ncbi:hypothetical protein [Mycobacterium sp.]|uniref:putative alpha/beta hydrolase n=1 Tax=Mycobacterium sp. TaxID=1785 RepID=UPI003A8C7857